MNRCYQTIKYTFEYSRSSVNYLDVLVSKNGCDLETDLFYKPTDTRQYLQNSSRHPGHIKRAIPCEQALGLRRIYSDEDKFRTRLEKLMGWLVSRGVQ